MQILCYKTMRFISLILATVVALCTSEGFGVTIQLNNEFGELKSPGFPEPYNNNEDITWEISTDPGYQIIVYFTVFDLEDSYDEEMGGACVYDYVQVENWGKDKKFCGNSKTYPQDAPKSWDSFRSKSNSMTIRFVSDYSNEFDGAPKPLGFRAHYKVEDKDDCAEMKRLVQTTVEDWDELVYCNHFCVNVPGSYYCTCRSGFELHENKHTCTGLCQDIVINDDEGVIESPDYPQPYPRLTDCDWTIQVEEGKSLNIQFDTNFKIENHPDEPGCVYDWLKVTMKGEQKSYCRDAPYNGFFIQTNLREVKLDLHSDHALEMVGFRMTYNTTRTKCLKPRDAPIDGSKTPNPKGFYEFEDEVLFHCDPGFDLTPPTGALVACQSDGSWDRQAPTCQIKSCGVPAALIAVPNSHITDLATLKFTYRDAVTVVCDDAYELVSGRVEWGCSEDGVWVATSPKNGENDIPVCSPICGIKNPGKLFVPHIARGAQTFPNEWPWMAFLNFGASPNLATRRSYCGGALISPEYVLTAGHCLTSTAFYGPVGLRPPNHIFVWLGAHSRWKSGASNASLFKVMEVIRHPQYNLRTLNYDFALLRLDKTVVMGQNIRPICIPSKPEHFNLLKPGNSSGWVAGWGISDNRPSFVLLHTNMPTVKKSVCLNDFREKAQSQSFEKFEEIYGNLTDKMFCAGDSFGTHGATCEGDSGGPFIQKLPSATSQKYYTLGLVSYGMSKHKCGQSESYTVFAKIDRSIAKWIRGEIATPPS